MGSSESVCDMCNVSEAGFVFNGRASPYYPIITPFKSVCGGEFYLCPDCVPADNSCSVKKWRELDGKNKYSYENRCWKSELFDSFYICDKCYTPDNSRTGYRTKCDCGGSIKCYVSNNLEDATNECKADKLIG